MSCPSWGHMKHLARAFNMEREMKMKVFNKILKIEGLTQNERMMVRRKISSDVQKINYFFSLLEKYRHAYVLSILERD